MIQKPNELHRCELGDEDNSLRPPTVLDVPRLRRELTRQGVRRPQLQEFRIAALAGIAALGEAAGEPAEAVRQGAVMQQWYDLLTPPSEDEIEEPDLIKRGEILQQQLEQRASDQAAIVSEVIAIEANLERHWPAYADLIADRRYWDDVSEIMAVRLLLRRRGMIQLERGPDHLLTEAAYLGLPQGDTGPLATFASALLAPDEAQRKN